MKRIRAGILATVSLVGACVLPFSTAAAAPAVREVTTTIQAAVDAAPPGSTIVIPRGRYHEAVTIDKSGLTLRAAPGAVLDGGGSLVDGLRVVAPAGQRINQFVLAGLTVQNFTRFGVYLRDVDNYRITGTVTRDILVDGLFPVRTSNGRIDHTVSTGSKDTGLYIGQSTNVTLDHNIDVGNTIGIDVEVSDGVIATNNLATGNAIGAIAQVVPGLGRTTTNGTVFRGNVFSGNNAQNPSTDPQDLLSQLPGGVGLLTVATANTEIQDNVVVDNRTVGIAVVQLPAVVAALDPRIDPLPRQVRVLSNLIFDNGWMPDPNYVPLSGNAVWDGSGSGNCWSGNQPVTAALSALPAC